MIPCLCRCIVLLVATAMLGCSAPGTLPRPPKGDLIKRDFLEQGTLERPGYGAYSYLLIPRAPATDERYLAILAAYLDGLPRDSHQPDASLAQINLTYVPVLANPGVRNLDWLAANYDVERAATLMHNECLTGAGPYLVIATSPASSRTPRKCDGLRDGTLDLIVLDLSNQSKAVMAAWLGYFGRSSDGPTHWNPSTLERVLMSLHGGLDRLGEASGAVIEALPGGAKILWFLR